MAVDRCLVSHHQDRAWLLVALIRIAVRQHRRWARIGITSWIWQTLRDQPLLRRVQTRECRNIRPPFNAPSARNASLGRIICGHICEPILMSGHLYVRCAGKPLLDNTIANGMKAFTAARRNLFAEVNFDRPQVNIGVVGEGSPGPMLWAGIFARRRAEYASSHSSRKKKWNGRIRP